MRRWKILGQMALRAIHMKNRNFTFVPALLGREQFLLRARAILPYGR